MAEPDLSSLTDQQRVTYWTGAIVRNDMLLEVTLRSILRDLHRRHPADPVPNEPSGFDALLEAVTAGVRAMDATAHASDILDALDETAVVHRRRSTLLHGLWAQQEGTDTFQMLELYPRDPDERAPGSAIAMEDFRALALVQVRVYVRLGGVELIVRHSSYASPFDSDAASAARHARVRGEFDVRDDGVVVARDPHLLS